MKRYQLKRKLNETVAQNDIPVWPVFESGDPTAGEVIYRFFDRHGNYKGWCSKTEGRKFLMGKLYYKTKGAYKIRSRKSHDSRTTRKIFVYEKNTVCLAAYAVLRVLTNEDFVDQNNREELVKISRESVEAFTFTPWNFMSYPNRYRIIPEETKTKLQKDLDNFMKSKKQEILDYLDAQIADIQQSKQINALASSIAGVEIEGLV